MNARHLLASLSLVLVAGGCPSGERCDIATYDAGCKGKSEWTYCADKDSTGFTKLWPSVVHMECKQHTECVEEGETASCVAAPAERCDVKDDERCVDGLSQRCWALGAQPDGVLYWQFVGLSC